MTTWASDAHWDGDPGHLIYAARVKRAAAVLYLDSDGVLQTDHVYQHHKRGVYIDQDRAPGRTLFEWAFHLEEALAAAPDVKLVLSTSWAQHPGFLKASQRLPESLQRRVIGATFHSRVHGANPWVLQWFRESPWPSGLGRCHTPQARGLGCGR